MQGYSKIQIKIFKIIIYKRVEFKKMPFAQKDAYEINFSLN